MNLQYGALGKGELDINQFQFYSIDIKTFESKDNSNKSGSILGC